MERIERGLRLLRVTVDLMREDPALVVVPLAGALLSVGILVVALMVAVAGARLGQGGAGLLFLELVAAMLAVGFVGVVARATIVVAATARIDGSDTTIGQALRGALTAGPALLGWAAISLVVGMLLRLVEQRRGMFSIIGRFAEVGWAALTFFVIPVMVFERRGPVDAISRSGRLFRGRWGEGLAGEGVLGLVVAIPMIVLAIVGKLLAPVAPVLAIVVVGPPLVVLVLLASTASGIFNAVLYRYATTGETGLGLYESDLNAAFRRRGGGRASLLGSFSARPTPFVGDTPAPIAPETPTPLPTAPRRPDASPRYRI
jgi:hypothetical protein